MQIKLFTIPISDNGSLLEEMNRFLRGSKVLEVDKQLVSNQNSASWCFCVSYIDTPYNSKFSGKKQKIDYINVLDEQTFKIFSKLREHRKKLAKEEGVPAYAIFTDEEIANIARLPEIKVEKLIEIKGIGEKKIKKYGKKIIDMYLDINKPKPLE